jgi:RNA polymerase sigma-70 factor, ECF subfamily
VALALDERALIHAWAGGDHSAFEVVFRRYEPLIKRSCRRILRNSSDAEEATQETFIKACKAIHASNPDTALGPWLRRIARNVCVDQLRARSRRPVAALDAPFPSRASTEPSPEEIVAGGDPRLDAVLDRLAPVHRAAVEMRFIMGMSHKEMAGVLSSSPVRVKALVHRARTRFSLEWASLASAA